MEDFFKNDNIPGGQQSVDSIVGQGFNLHVGNHLKSGVKQFGREAGIFIAFTLVYIAISMVVGALPYIGDVAGIIVGPPLVAGFAYYARLQKRNEFRDFSSFFNGFKSGHWPSLVSLSIMINLSMLLLIFLVVLPIFWAPIQVFISELERVESMAPEKMGEFLFSILTPEIIQSVGVAVFIAFVVMSFLCMAPFFIVYRGYSAFQAISASVRIVRRKFLDFLLLNAVLFCLLIAGIMLCCVGFLAALPIYYLVLADAYEHITGD